MITTLMAILLFALCLTACGKNNLEDKNDETLIKCCACEDVREGKTFSVLEQYTLSNHISNVPLTMETEIKILLGDDTTQGIIVGNDDNWNRCIDYYIAENGHPKVFFKNRNVHIKGTEYIFENVDVRSFNFVHLAITFDMEKSQLNCYLDGELKQTIENVEIQEQYELKHNFIIGGDRKGGNKEHFKGVIRNISLWSDVRSAEEVLCDYKNGITGSEEGLLAAYDLTKCQDCLKLDISNNQNDLSYQKLWQEPSAVDSATDYAYSFAVIGDTQELSEKFPNKMAALYDWIVSNADEQKIECVIGLGDITQKSKDEEWAYAKEQIYKMNGVVPYTLVRGNHDKALGYNATFNDEEYLKELSGVMTEGDLTNAYKLLDVGNVKYLIMILDYDITDDELAWAGEIISANPERRVIITTHTYLYRDGTLLGSTDAYPSKVNTGDDIWEKLVSKYDNIEMVICGHDPSQDIVYLATEGKNGNTVHQLLIDPQNVDYYLDGVAMVAMFYFSEDGNTLTIRYYSVTEDMYGSEKSNFTINLN